MKVTKTFNLLSLIIFSAFSLTAIAGHEDDLIKALEREDFTQATQIFTEHEKAINPDYKIIEGPYHSETVLWSAAAYQQWPLVTRMLELNPKANVNAAPAEGPNRGATVLWWAARYKQWPLVTRMLELNPNANVDAAPAKGPHRGGTVLWWVVAWAAVYQQWPLATRMLELNPNANFDAVPAEGLQRSNVRSYISNNAPIALAKLYVIQQMNKDVEGMSLESRLTALASGHLEELVAAVSQTFRSATIAFTNLLEETRIVESSVLEYHPRVLRNRFALAYLREEDPDLSNVSDSELLKLLLRFHTVYKTVDYKGRSVEVVAAKVLSKLAPIENREDTSANRVKRIKTVRGWIIDAITNAIKSGILPEQLDADLRQQLANSLSEKTINDITHKWIKETIKNFREQQLHDDEEGKPKLKKRERDVM